MKHTIRQRVINEYGLPTVKHTTVYGELGSGILDKNGVEIFEGDIVKIENGETVTITNSNWFLLYRNDSNALQVIGHAED